MNIKCFRCGFPGGERPCPLCGDASDLKKEIFREEAREHYVITLAIPEADEGIRTSCGDFFSELPGDIAYKKKENVHYVLFETHQADHLFRLTDKMAGETPWKLLFNGCEYPFGRELWYPLLSFFQYARD